MEDKSILISEEHGVNPSLEQCFVCMEPKGVILFGRMKGDVKAPHMVCLDQEPCDKCEEYMEKGIILISVDDKLTTDEQNPHRTGGWVVVKEEAVVRMFGEGNEAVKRRMAFVVDETWDGFGLPRGAKEE